ncbi:MAG: inorganic phosphate transporter [Planctomycetales bacterium]
MTVAIILAAVVCLAWANGANDNFKGVATLYGSGTAGYRRALAWGTVTTLAGSLCAVFLAGTLLAKFSGNGLVADESTRSASYGAAVALGAGLTVLLASRLGMPISTTHGLVGALVGAGWAAGSPIVWAKLGSGFFAPLLLSPFCAAAAVAVLYPALRSIRRRLGISATTCLCVGRETIEVIPAGDAALAVARVTELSARVGDAVTCRSGYAGRVLGIEAGPVLDGLHYLSAGVVSFARGLNDAPKIAAVLLLASPLGGAGSVALVAVAMAAGGWLGARRVADTMGHRVTEMNHGQGFAANAITGVLVLAASPLGLPVSTTHVSCGALFGIGAATGQGSPNTIARILLAWVTTLPLAAACGAACYAAIAGT